MSARAQTTIQNDDSPPGVFITSQIIQNEGNAGTTPFVFSVNLTNPSALTTTVDFATIANTASSPVDYEFNSGTLTFAPLSTSQSITVLVNGDAVCENLESFFVQLSNPQNATIIGTGRGTGFITNDDPFPSVKINDVTLAEGNTGTKSFVFDLTLSPPSEVTSSVGYFTMDGDASETSDYQADANIAPSRRSPHPVRSRSS